MSCLLNIKKWFNPKEPNREKPKIILPQNYYRPVISDVNIEVKTYGKFKTKNKKAMGAVIHFTAGHYGNDQDALNSLASMADRGYGAIVLGRGGQFFKAQNQGLDDVVYHAGVSKWKDKESISYYCLGIEVVCGGKLDKNGRTWFGTKPPEEECRYVLGKDNVETGKYHMFTPQQELSLRNFMLCQSLINPEFRFSWVVGHDEIAVPKGRRNDPGGAFSMTMPEFRQLLFQHVLYE